VPATGTLPVIVFSAVTTSIVLFAIGLPVLGGGNRPEARDRSSPDGETPPPA
jgi:hypothetical protein